MPAVVNLDTKDVRDASTRIILALQTGQTVSRWDRAILGEAAYQKLVDDYNRLGPNVLVERHTPPRQLQRQKEAEAREWAERHRGHGFLGFLALVVLAVALGIWEGLK
jgi:hypothetical protein